MILLKIKKCVSGPRKQPVQWLYWSYSDHLGPPGHPGPLRGPTCQVHLVQFFRNKIIEAPSLCAFQPKFAHCRFTFSGEICTQEVQSLENKNLMQKVQLTLFEQTSRKHISVFCTLEQEARKIEEVLSWPIYGQYRRESSFLSLSKAQHIKQKAFILSPPHSIAMWDNQLKAKALSCIPGSLITHDDDELTSTSNSCR